MLVYGLVVIVSLAILVWSADRFVEGASDIAQLFGISPLIVGITIIGFGTSAPEMLVSLFAAIQGDPAIGMGNALGSDIANIALILGCTAIVCPLVIAPRLLKLEIPILIVTMLITYYLISNGLLTRVNAFTLFAILFGILTFLVIEAIKNPTADSAEEIQTPSSMTKAIVLFMIGLLLLLASSRGLVWGASAIAKEAGISDLVIGLTIVAIGTSLPELAATIISAKKQQVDMAVGNIIGSNLFNTLGVLAIPGLIANSIVPREVLTRDFPIAIGLTVAIIILAYKVDKKHRIGRYGGILLLISFIAYQILLFSTQ